MARISVTVSPGAARTELVGKHGETVTLIRAI